jgi:hypothetical protein
MGVLPANLFHYQLARAKNRASAQPRFDDLDQCAAGLADKNPAMEWKPISTAPFDRDLELAVVDRDGPHALVFPCRRILGGWLKVETKQRVDVHPTHWRDWEQAH